MNILIPCLFQLLVGVGALDSTTASSSNTCGNGSGRCACTDPSAPVNCCGSGHRCVGGGLGSCTCVSTSISSEAWINPARRAGKKHGPQPLRGLALVHNAPSEVSLLTINATTGKASVIGPAHSELFGLGDLVTVANDQFYYLGDTAAGATLVALNLTTGAEICTQHVDVATIKFVGIGQSLDHDAVTGSLVLSGVASNLSSGTHSVYRAPDVGCGSMTHVGHFGLANYLPSIHSSSFDAKGQRLFVTVATNKSTTAIGILDLTSGNMSVVPEGGAAAPNLHDTITGMHWDVGTQMLLGVMPSSDDSTLQLHALQVPSGANPTWFSKSLSGVPSKWDALGGNSGTASAFNSRSGLLYFTAGTTDPTSGEIAWELASVNVDLGTVMAHPPLSFDGPISQCSDCLMALTARIF